MSEVTTRKLAADFKVVMDDVEELIKATASQTGERIGDLRQRLEQKIEVFRKTLVEKSWFTNAGQAKAQAESRFRENPWLGLAVATGIGLLIGLLRRRD